MNKRGQEGLTLTTLLLIVLGAVVVVVIILGATGAFNFVFGKLDVLPGQDLQTVVSSCELAGEQGLRADYCSSMKEAEIDGKKQFVTCSYSKVEAIMDQSTKLSPSCGTEVSSPLGYQAIAKAFCESGQIRDSDFDEVLVNGQDCNDWGVLTKVAIADAAKKKAEADAAAQKLLDDAAGKTPTTPTTTTTPPKI